MSHHKVYVQGHCTICKCNCCSAGQVRSTQQATTLKYLRSPEQAAAAVASAERAAAKEAAANATPGKAEGYGHSSTGQAGLSEDLVAHMTVASAASIPQAWLSSTSCQHFDI